jgi:hypothetical protein
MVTQYDLVPSQRFLQEFIANGVQSTGLESSGRVFRAKGLQLTAFAIGLGLPHIRDLDEKACRSEGLIRHRFTPMTLTARVSLLPQNPRDLE